MELALATRNIQRREAQQIAEAWGNVSCILVVHPRVTRKGLQLDKLEIAVPELFKELIGVPSKRIFLIKDPVSSHYNDEKLFAERARLAVCSALNAPPLHQMAQEASTMMWEPSGVCPCGKRGPICLATA